MGGGGKNRVVDGCLVAIQVPLSEGTGSRGCLALLFQLKAIPVANVLQLVVHLHVVPKVKRLLTAKESGHMMRVHLLEPVDQTDHQIHEEILVIADKVSDLRQRSGRVLIGVNKAEDGAAIADAVQSEVSKHGHDVDNENLPCLTTPRLPLTVMSHVPSPFL
jgi:hypothetical protein